MRNYTYLLGNNPLLYWCSCGVMYEFPFSPVNAGLTFDHEEYVTDVHDIMGSISIYYCNGPSREAPFQIGRTFLMAPGTTVQCIFDMSGAVDCGYPVFTEKWTFRCR